MDICAMGLLCEVERVGCCSTMLWTVDTVLWESVVRKNLSFVGLGGSSRISDVAIRQVSLSPWVEL